MLLVTKIYLKVLKLGSYSRHPDHQGSSDKSDYKGPCKRKSGIKNYSRRIGLHNVIKEPIFPS